MGLGRMVRRRLALSRDEDTGSPVYCNPKRAVCKQMLKQIKEEDKRHSAKVEGEKSELESVGQTSGGHGAACQSDGYLCPKRPLTKALSTPDAELIACPYNIIY